MMKGEKRDGTCRVSIAEVQALDWNGVLPMNVATLNMLASKGAPIHGCCNPHLSPDYNWFSVVEPDTGDTVITWRYKDRR